MEKANFQRMQSERVMDTDSECDETEDELT